MTQEDFEEKYTALREKLANEGISEETINAAENVDDGNTNPCSGEWLDLFEDTARSLY